MKKKIRPGALFKEASFSTFHKDQKRFHIKNIVILGDSVAYGYGTKGGISKYLKEAFSGCTVTNLGINGLTSNGLVERLRSGIWDRYLTSADMVLLNIGGNDLLRGFRSSGAKGLIRQFSQLKRTYRKNLLETYQYIRSLNDDVLIVQNNLYNSMKKEFQYFGFTNLLFRLWNTAIGEEGVIISRTDVMGKNPSIWLDSIHPNEEGYKLMHELLMKTLKTTGIDIHPRETAKGPSSN
ncbi:GDSL-type esterase/lipase family protein [Planomicrobium sp. CPCC 101110]|uniref:GDSL-type esterase/lipase family protein n=1 Tax=Planomicrobium sp. CPCC 101110 TaxID=2599619 RepID=UPI0016462EE5|nr:GDSL-type esterase/lipase family protein [Planomicrobium sp. CPCC 101110]